MINKLTHCYLGERNSKLVYIFHFRQITDDFYETLNNWCNENIANDYEIENYEGDTGTRINVHTEESAMAFKLMWSYTDIHISLAPKQ